MKKILLLILLLSCIFYSEVKCQTNKLSTDNNYFELKRNHNSIIVSFNSNPTKSSKDFPEDLKNQLKLGNNADFVFINATKDNNGFVHNSYQQTINGVPVENCILLIHEKDGKLKSANGQLIFSEQISAFNHQSDVKPEITEAAAKLIAKNSFPQLPSTSSQHPAIIKIYSPVLIILSFKENLYLVFKVRVETKEPLRIENVYINAKTGDVLIKVNLIADADVPGTSQYILQRRATCYYRKLFRRL